MKILIVGGGIGGLTAALALARAEHEITVVEKCAEFAPVGAGIIIAANAAQLLAHLGVDLSSRGLALPAMDILQADGRRMQHLDMSALARIYGPTWALSRPSLHDAIRQAFPRHVDLRHGCTLQRLQRIASGVEVTFHESASPSCYDVVIGADGLHSSVRAMLLGPQPLRYSGVTCWRGLVANPGFTHAMEAWGGDARVGLVPLRDGQLYYYLVLTAPPRAPAPDWPDGFQQWFGHFGGEPGRLLTALPGPPPLHHDLVELHQPAWGRDRVFLLGDAAHAMTPNQGQGAAMAVEDAFVLAQTLSEGIGGALSRYRARRHARVRTMQVDSRRLGQIAHWRNPVARTVRDRLFTLLPAALGHAQYRRMIEPGLALLKTG